MGNRLFIFGGSGFVGKHLSTFLSAQGFDVSIFDKWIDEEFFSSYPEIKCHICNVLEEAPSSDIAAPDFIVNLAATAVTPDNDLDGIGKLIEDNINIINHLYNRFKDDSSLKLFVHFGSIEEYGPIQPPLCENSPERPCSGYAIMKLACTNYCMMLAKNKGFPVCIVRPGNLFGKGQNPKRFITYVLKMFREDKPIDVSPCEQKRDFIYIKDFCRLISKMLENYQSFQGETVNVCSGKSIALKTIIKSLYELTGSKSEIHYGALPYRMGEIMDLCCSNEKLQRLLGEKISINTIDRLQDYVDEY